ncbi:MAG: methylated-DNA--[protein]-cysteine S-methyltransferase, partial [Bacteroidales bacterium]|nr:methylated-DNA--[protein]-cysteine S-methyltransferase [Bacteroidales bacterium]
DAYFSDENPCVKDLPLAPQGTAFRQSVWKALCEIPYGTTITYGDLAQRLSSASGRYVSPRAVGNAVGRNPISIIIPCHRVVGADGSLTGYAGGLERKRFLLRLEGVRQL